MLCLEGEVAPASVLEGGALHHQHPSTQVPTSPTPQGQGLSQICADQCTARVVQDVIALHANTTPPSLNDDAKLFHSKEENSTAFVPSDVKR